MGIFQGAGAINRRSGPRVNSMRADVSAGTAPAGLLYDAQNWENYSENALLAKLLACESMCARGGFSRVANLVRAAVSPRSGAMAAYLTMPDNRRTKD